MGQAKRRGTLDQRIEQAKSEQLRQLEAWEAERQRKREAEQAAWDALPEIERYIITKRQNQSIGKSGTSSVLMASLMLAAAGGLMPYPPRNTRRRCP